MLRIGYVRLQDSQSEDYVAQLKATGCHVVRAEESAAAGQDDAAILFSILEFIGAGDELVVTRLAQLGPSARGTLDVVERLDQRGASLTVLEPALSSVGATGAALRAALEAVAEFEPQQLRRRRTDAQQILDLQRAGVGPVEIARRLGVSRMTVWRKLKAVAA